MPWWAGAVKKPHPPPLPRPRHPQPLPPTRHHLVTSNNSLTHVPTNLNNSSSAPRIKLTSVCARASAWRWRSVESPMDYLPVVNRWGSSDRGEVGERVYDGCKGLARGHPRWAYRSKCRRPSLESLIRKKRIEYWYSTTATTTTTT